MDKKRHSAFDRRQALRLLGGGIAAVTVGGLAGCGGDEATPAAKTATPEPKPVEDKGPAAKPPETDTTASTETAPAAAEPEATPAPAAEPTRVAEDEAQAQALGYRHDASTVDGSRFATYAPGQACANCALFAGEAGDAWGACPIFGNRLVNAKGWCSAYVAKA